MRELREYKGEKERYIDGATDRQTQRHAYGQTGRRTERRTGG